MPCRTDYMEPNAQERHRRQAAEHLVYIFGRLSGNVPRELSEAASDLYGGGTDKWVETLCTLLREMTDEQRDRIVYDAKDKRSRALADWWEEHCRVDDAREALEAAEEAATKKPTNFDAQNAFVRLQYDSNLSIEDIGRGLAERTGLYFDFEDSTHIFPFDSGVIILSKVDGLMAYKGKCA